LRANRHQSRERLLRRSKTRRTEPEKRVSGSPSCDLAQLSPDSIERLPYLIVM
jgi:hypothetical protein